MRQVGPTQALPPTRPLPTLALALTLLALGGCGFGSGILGSAAGGSSGGGNAPPTPTLLAWVEDVGVTRLAATSPAELRLKVTDPDSDKALVTITWKVQDNHIHDPDNGTLTADPLSVNTNKEERVTWDFEDALGSAAYHDGITLELTVEGGSGSEELTTAVGNDPPVMLRTRLLPIGLEEYSDNVFVGFWVQDTADDPVRIKIEFTTDGGISWDLARPVGTSPGEPTPAFAFVDFPSSSSTKSGKGTFVWDSVFDLAGTSTDVALRFTAEDDYDVGISKQTQGFVIDNNAEPFAVLDEGSLVSNPDQRRGIPVPFRVFDEESDRVKVLVQWRREGEPFPPLPTTAEDLTNLLEDADREDERREKHIALPAPPPLGGRAEFLPGLSDNQIRLPELAGSAAGLVVLGLANGTLEILRPSSVPEPLTWNANPLDGPVAVLPGEDGPTALVLHRGSAGWRVGEIDLATGKEVQASIASGDGEPRGMTLGPLKKHLFVASSTALFRLSYPDGEARGKIPHSFLDGPRGIAALGTEIVVATGDDSLVQFNFGIAEATGTLHDRSDEPSIVGAVGLVHQGTAVTLLDGLAEPWGVLVDPLVPGGLYLAERAADRVVAVDLNSLVPRPVAARVDLADVGALGPIPFPSPRSLALERSGERLLVLTQETGGTTSLRGLDLYSRLDPVKARAALVGADPFVFEITDQLGDETGGMTTGADGLRIVALPSSNALAVGGGIQQVRVIVDEPTDGDSQPYCPATQVVVVTEAFYPVPRTGAPWRIRTSDFLSDPQGASNVFLWESSEVVGGGKVQLRIVPLDSDVGTEAVGTAFKVLSSGLDVEPELLMDLRPGSPRSVAAGDLDGDGDLDLASANGSGGDLTIFLQEERRTFARTVTHSDLGELRSVTAADLDGDGDVDLVSANRSNDELSMFFQGFPGQFERSDPLRHTDLATPRSLAAADLDGDGDMDLVSANESDNLTLFVQEEPGQFVPGTTIDDESFGSPRSVVAADLDQDGDLDLVTANLVGLSIYFQDSQGRFTTHPGELVTDLDLVFPTFARAADLDADGDLDLVSPNLEGLTIFFQTDSGQFTVDPAGPLTSSDFGTPVSVAAADLDGDADLDLLSVSSSRVHIFFQIDPGRFFFDPDQLLTVLTPQDAAAADIDGDGNVDLVSVAQSGLGLFFQDAPGVFAQSSNGIIRDPAAVDGPRSVAARDLDGDGDLDLVSANRASNNLTIFRQEVPGQFALDPVGPISHQDLDRPHSIAAADLDGDGDLDLVSGNQRDLTVFLQDSSGQFLLDQLLRDPLLGDPQSLAVADLDRDGDLDLVSANRFTIGGDDHLAIFSRVDPSQSRPQPPVDPPKLDGASPGQGALEELKARSPVPPDPEDWFSLTQLLIAPGILEQPHSVAAADLDGNGYYDLISANKLNVTIFLGQSLSGSPPVEFALEPPLLPAGNPKSVAVGDLDSDGDLDLVSAYTPGFGGLAMFFQDASGKFDPNPSASLSGPGAQVRSVAAADLDGDGDVDLVLSYGLGLAAFFQGAPGGRYPWGRRALFAQSSPVFAQSVVALDLDGDGETDLLSAYVGTDTLSIFFGGH